MENVINKIKIALGLFLTGIILGCSNNEGSGNSSPSEFEVTVSDITFTEAKLNWTESQDPEGNTVFYDIYLNSEKLADNITDLSYILNDLEEGVMYSGNIVASDPDGNETIVIFSFETSVNQPPTAFNVTVVTKDPLYSRINWTESQDPEGGSIIYNVYLKDELIGERVTNLYFFFQDLKGITSYSGYVEAIDPDGKTFISNFSFFTELKVYDRDIRLENQSEVNNFGASCYNKIEGNLIIGSTNTNLTDISNLESLNTIKSITGDIFYVRKTICENLNGLENIKPEHTYTRLTIQENNELINVNGLDAIQTIHELNISQNEKLLKIDGLKNLTTVTNDIYINNNFSLNSIIGLSNLNSIADLTISGTNGLTNLKGLENVRYIRTLELFRNDGLISIEGLNNLEECSAGVYITNNNALIDFTYFSNLNSVHGLYIDGNMQLKDLSGLENLVQVKRDIVILRNENLESLNGINNIGFSGGTPRLYKIAISNNDKITNLDALENVTLEDGRLYVALNPELVNLCGLTKLIKKIDSEGLSTTTTIEDNKFNPTFQDILDGNCSQ